VILLALATGVLLAVGSLRELVESASLAFLCTFAAVNAMAFFELAGRRRALAALGALGASAAAVTLVAKWVSSGQWTALIALGALLLLAFGARPLLLRAAPTED
jgi:hypothetical protein